MKQKQQNIIRKKHYSKPLPKQNNNLKSLALLLQLNTIKGFLITGPKGSGKTILLEQFHSHFPHKKIYSLHLDSEIDSKMLLGMYCCAKTPGEFEFTAGPLSKAAISGNWIILENIHKSSFEVIASLIPFLTQNHFYLNGTKNDIHSEFRIFGTCSEEINDQISTQKPQLKIIKDLFHCIATETFTIEEIGGIIKEQFPLILDYKLFPLSYECFQMVYGTTEDDLPSPLLYKKHFSLSSFFKCCKRINSLLKTRQEKFLHSRIKEKVLKNMENCFLAWIPEITKRNHFFTEFGKKLNISTQRIKQLLNGVLDDIPGGDFMGEMAPTNHSKRLINAISLSVKYNEPLLLVGETGTGKTTIIQNYARHNGKSLLVHNLHQQSEVEDLVGGFKPSNCRNKANLLIKDFLGVVDRVSSDENLSKPLVKAIKSQNWGEMVSKMTIAMKKAKIIIKKTHRVREMWPELKQIIQRLQNFNFETNSLLKKNCSFEFVEGTLLKAVKNGNWILLDELNLAPANVHERIDSLLEAIQNEKTSVNLMERSGVEEVEIHKDFRLFASYNPPGDFGKRHLPDGIREKFTELFVEDILDPNDLRQIIRFYLGRMELEENLVETLCERLALFYTKTKRMCRENSLYCNSKAPNFSVRSLVRSLNVFKRNLRFHSVKRALFDGLTINFLAPLNEESAEILRKEIETGILECKEIQTTKYKQNTPRKSENYVEIDGFFVKKGGFESKNDKTESFILTEDINRKIRSLLRIISSTDNAVLLEGPTSSGKTSLVKYISKITGHKCVRINNHEHTDLQEYLGGYTSDVTGILKLKEGVLVEAVRKGYWMILDELNLAPTEVLEALNRLLDENREILISETGETVKAHGDFRLFATQNPAGLYQGRKQLSKAFKNRFIEMNVEEIPFEELSGIIHLSCGIARSFANAMVSTMRDVQIQGQVSDVFSLNKKSITARNLFRWALRKPTTYQELAESGYMVLGEKLESKEEKGLIKKVLESHCKLSEINENSIYTKRKIEFEKLTEKAILSNCGVKGIVWTSEMIRLFNLVLNCIENKEPVLLIGETGSSKTTVCQLMAIYKETKLHIFNCNQNSEAFDFIGELRPVRNKETLNKRLKTEIFWFFEAEKIKNVYFALKNAKNGQNLTKTIKFFSETDLKTFEKFRMKIDSFKSKINNCENLKLLNDFFDAFKPILEVICDDSFTKRVSEIERLRIESNRMFKWKDGVLLQAMKKGEIILFDEISLAENAVIERLNSVLEKERTIFVPEMSNGNSQEIEAHENFGIIATMNPPGDYGKKDLSKALKNRFTEIFVPSLLTDKNTAREVIRNRLRSYEKKGEIDAIAEIMTEFVKWFNETQFNSEIFSLRNLLIWCDFVISNTERLDLKERLIEGLQLLISYKTNEIEVKKCSEKMGEIFTAKMGSNVKTNGKNRILTDFSSLSTRNRLDEERGMIGIDPFYIYKGDGKAQSFEETDFYVNNRTSFESVYKLLRAMQLKRAILMEGSPGVGKTSLIVSLARLTGNRLTRINLSEHTDMMDLLGSDFPSKDTGNFEWMDGALLKAVKEGKWVLLDELNLAPQTVLEGLNSLLDHRENVFIPELNKTVSCPKSFRIFACQNPLKEGGGRKGLPASFLNRFIKVKLEHFNSGDMENILRRKFPEINAQIVKDLVKFNGEIERKVCEEKSFGLEGSPWEFNLRDLFKVTEMITRSDDTFQKVFFPQSDQVTISVKGLLAESVEKIYLRRFRTAEDRLKVKEIFEKTFQMAMETSRKSVNSDSFFVFGETIVEKRTGKRRKLLNLFEKSFELFRNCIGLRWPVMITGNHSLLNTKLVKSFSKVVGQELQIFHINPEFESADFLGSFEQFDLKRQHQKNIQNLSEIPQLEGFLQEHKNETIYQIAKELISQEKKILNRIESHRHKELFKTVVLKYRKILGNSEEENSTCFQWVDSPFIESVEKGKWILMENINFCKPAVLDRINSLLEPNGELLLNECGSVNGEVRKIIVHENFRVFMTLNPNYGEVSRAMRNRCIEIHQEPIGKNDLILMISKHLKSPKICRNIVEFYLNDICGRDARNKEVRIETLLNLSKLIKEKGKEIDEKYLKLCYNEIYGKKHSESLEIHIKKLFHCIRNEFALVDSAKEISTESNEVNSFFEVIENFIALHETSRLTDWSIFFLIFIENFAVESYSERNALPLNKRTIKEKLDEISRRKDCEISHSEFNEHYLRLLLLVKEIKVDFLKEIEISSKSSKIKKLSSNFYFSEEMAIKPQKHEILKTNSKFCGMKLLSRYILTDSDRCNFGGGREITMIVTEIDRFVKLFIKCSHWDEKRLERFEFGTLFPLINCLDGLKSIDVSGAFGFFLWRKIVKLVGETKLENSPIVNKFITDLKQIESIKSQIISKITLRMRRETDRIEYKKSPKSEFSIEFLPSYWRRKEVHFSSRNDEKKIRLMDDIWGRIDSGKEIDPILYVNGELKKEIVQIALNSPETDENEFQNRIIDMKRKLNAQKQKFAEEFLPLQFERRENEDFDEEFCELFDYEKGDETEENVFEETNRFLNDFSRFSLQFLVRKAKTVTDFIENLFVNDFEKGPKIDWMRLGEQFGMIYDFCVSFTFTQSKMEFLTVLLNLRNILLGDNVLNNDGNVTDQFKENCVGFLLHIKRTEQIHHQKTHLREYFNLVRNLEIKGRNRKISRLLIRKSAEMEQFIKEWGEFAEFKREKTQNTKFFIDRIMSQIPPTKYNPFNKKKVDSLLSTKTIQNLKEEIDIRRKTQNSPHVQNFQRELSFLKKLVQLNERKLNKTEQTNLPFCSDANFELYYNSAKLLKGKMTEISTLLEKEKFVDGQYILKEAQNLYELKENVYARHLCLHLHLLVDEIATRNNGMKPKEIITGNEEMKDPIGLVSSPTKTMELLRREMPKEMTKIEFEQIASVFELSLRKIQNRQSKLSLESTRKENIMAEVIKLWEINERNRSLREDIENRKFTFKTDQNLEEENLEKLFPTLETERIKKEQNAKDQNKPSNSPGLKIIEDKKFEKMAETVLFWPKNAAGNRWTIKLMRRISEMFDGFDGTEEFDLTANKSIAFLLRNFNVYNDYFCFFDENLNYDRNWTIYSKMNSQQSNKLIDSLDSFQSKIESLLNFFPNNSVLLNLADICDRILNFPILRTSPLNYCSTTELLLKKSQEDWESISAKKYSIEKEINSVVTVLSLWRKTELTHWGKLLDKALKMETSKEVKAVISISKLLENEGPNEIKATNKETLRALEQYLLQSKVGNFGMRIRLIQWATRRKKYKRERASLRNLHHYYKQYIGLRDDYLQNSKIEVSKTINDVTNITSWDDRNYWRFKETIKKSRKQIAKALKKWNEFLATPMQTLIERKRVEFATKKKIEINDAKGEENENNNGRKRKHPTGQKIESKGRDSTFFSKIIERTKNGGKEILSVKMSAKIEKLSGRIMESIEKLQEKGTTTEKLRSLLSLFVFIGNLTNSFKTNHSSLDSENEREFSNISDIPSYGDYSELKPFGRNGDNGEMIDELFKSSEDYFYKNLERRVSLQSLLKSCKDKEISNKHKNKMGKISKLLFENNVMARKALISLLKQRKFVYDFISLMEPKSITAKIAIIKDSESILENFIEDLIEMDSIVDIFIEKNDKTNFVLDSKGNFCQVQLLEATRIESRKVLAELTKLQQIRRFKRKNGSDLMGGLCDFANTQKLLWVYRKSLPVANLCSKIKNDCVLRDESLLRTVLNFEKSFNSISKKFEQFNSKSDGNCDFSNENSIFSRINRKFADFTEKIIEINTEIKDSNRSKFENNEFIKLQNHYKKTEKTIKSLSERLTERIDLKILQPNHQKPLQKTVGIFNKTAAEIDYLLTSLLLLDRTMNKLSYILSSLFGKICLFGFCPSPKEQSSLEKKENADGVGMGEGEGEKDVTDQLENEEQILGLKDEEKDSNGKNELEDDKEENNAALVDADFEGDFMSDERSDEELSEEESSNDSIENLMDENFLESENEDEKLSEKMKKQTGTDQEEMTKKDQKHQMASDEEDPMESEENLNEEKDNKGTEFNEEIDSFEEMASGDENETDKNEEKSSPEDKNDTSDSLGDNNDDSGDDLEGNNDSETAREIEKDSSEEIDGEKNQFSDDEIDSSSENDSDSLKNEENQSVQKTSENAIDLTQNSSETNEKESNEINANPMDKNHDGMVQSEIEEIKRFKEGNEFISGDNNSSSERWIKLPIKRKIQSLKAERPTPKSSTNQSINQLGNPSTKSENFEGENESLRKMNRIENKTESEINETITKFNPFNNRNGKDGQTEERNEEGNELQSEANVKVKEESKPKDTADKIENMTENPTKNDNSARNENPFKIEKSFYNKDVSSKGVGRDFAKVNVDFGKGFEKRGRSDGGEGLRLWGELTRSTMEITAHLNQSLSRILSPNVASRLEGDYKTGKRLNMRRVIPYIASSFKRDKIWMRRTRRNKRHYQIMLAIDNSQSMRDRNCCLFAQKALVSVVNALNTLETGEVAIAQMGSKSVILRDFDEAFSVESEAETLSRFDFNDCETKWEDFLECSFEYLRKARVIYGRSGEEDVLQLVLVMTDGAIQEDRERVKRLARRSLQNGQLIVAVLIDESLVGQQLVEFVEGEVVQKPFLEDYPLPHYIVVREVEHLPEVLAEALKQWFEMVVSE